MKSFSLYLHWIVQPLYQKSTLLFNDDGLESVFILLEVSFESILNY